KSSSLSFHHPLPIKLYPLSLHDALPILTGKKGFQLGRAPFINGSEGFIKNPQACATQIQSGQGNPSQLAGRELVARSFFVAVQTDLFEGGIDGGAGFRTTDSGVPAEIFEGTQRFLYPRQMPQI